MAKEFTVGRGDTWEFDPDPLRNRKWPRLFSDTQNYRALGDAVMGSESSAGTSDPCTIAAVLATAR